MTTTTTTTAVLRLSRLLRRRFFGLPPLLHTNRTSDDNRHRHDDAFVNDQRHHHLDEKSKSKHLYDQIPVANVRNFSIVAHVDHGKSTLADRLMELCHAIDVSTTKGGVPQMLDRLPVERKRGITVKAQSVALLYRHSRDRRKGEAEENAYKDPSRWYLLNLIDTPGHADFSFEVSRSLSECEGCVLLVDATQGVQAQTVAQRIPEPRR